MVAAAGSGKTTWIVNQALEQTHGNVLITTYTVENAKEIERKITEINRAMPEYITVQTWFSFLLQHGVKPYQGKMILDHIRGLILVNEQSVRYIAEEKTKEHYFTDSQKIYSDKLSKFVIKNNERSSGAVIDRLKRIYTHIYVDEVQDLAGYDLDVLRMFFASVSDVLLVGDPRQVTYLTHPAKLYSPYRNGRIKEFVTDKKLDCEIDEITLNRSHRNNWAICAFSSRLYPNFPPSEPCACEKCRNNTPEHDGLFLIRPSDVGQYIEIYSPKVLRQQQASEGEWTYGASKGLGFDRVLIYPTLGILKYLKDGKLTKTKKSETIDAFDIAKFYVAVTRARYSVGIVCDFKNESYIAGLIKWNVIVQTQLF